MSYSLRPHGLQHARAPCPSPTPRPCSNSHPSSQWCHPTISFSVIPFSSCLQSFPASGSFQMSQLFTSGGQSTGISASASVLPVNIQDWFPLGLTGFLLAVQGTGYYLCFYLTLLLPMPLFNLNYYFFQYTFENCKDSILNIKECYMVLLSIRSPTSMWYFFCATWPVRVFDSKHVFLKVVEKYLFFPCFVKLIYLSFVHP